MQPLSERERRIFELGAIAILVAAAVGYGAGRYATPARVEDHTAETDRARLKVAETAKTTTESKGVTNTTDMRDDRKEKVVTFKRDKLPDGTVHEEGTVVYRQRTTDALVSQLQFSAGSQAQVTRTTTAELDHTLKTDHVVVSEHPRLNLGVGVGAAVGWSPLNVSPTYLVFGSYRLLGPISLGAWATFNQAGLSPTAGVLVSLTL